MKTSNVAFKPSYYDLPKKGSGEVVRFTEYHHLKLVKEVLDECRRNIHEAVLEYQQDINDALSDFYTDMATSINKKES